MYMKKFTEIPRPVLVSSLRHGNIEDAIEDVKLSEELGAQAFLLHIELLDKEYRHADKLARIFASTEKPVMALNYRTEKTDDDEKLSELLLDCVKAGAAAADMWLHMYDTDALGSLTLTDKSFATARPAQVSMRPEAVEKQRKFIDKVHMLGGEVLASAHVGVFLNAEQGVALAQEIESRGADITKIITACGDYGQALEILRTDAMLNEKTTRPYLYQCSGKYGALVRLAAPLFGSHFVLCHSKHEGVANREKPLLKEAKEVLGSIHWRLSDEIK